MADEGFGDGSEFERMGNQASDVENIRTKINLSLRWLNLRKKSSKMFVKCVCDKDFKGVFTVFHNNFSLSEFPFLYPFPSSPYPSIP